MPKYDMNTTNRHGRRKNRARRQRHTRRQRRQRRQRLAEAKRLTMDAIAQDFDWYAYRIYLLKMTYIFGSHDKAGKKRAEYVRRMLWRLMDGMLENAEKKLVKMRDDGALTPDEERLLDDISMWKTPVTSP